MRQIDGLVTKDEIYRLISGFRTRFKISEEAAHEMAKRVAEMPTIEAEPDKGWISVKDRLPKPKTWVMVYVKYPSPVLELERGIHKISSIKKMFYDGKSFYCDFGTITHWRPLSEKPKGE